MMIFLIAVEVVLIIAAGYLAYRLWAQNTLIEQLEAKNKELHQEAGEVHEQCTFAIGGLLGDVQELKLEAEDQRHNEMLYSRKHEAHIHEWYRDKLAKILEQKQ